MAQSQETEEEKGVITEISKDRCVVSINANGTTEALAFGKSLLYTWGLQCDGDMTNILEEDMEVNVRYKCSRSQNKPSIIAVWIGEIPDLANESSIDDEPLEDIYNQEGVVDRIDDGKFIVSVDNIDVSVVVSLDVMHKEGCKAEESPVTIGESVMFDAIPCGEPAGRIYKATCAWIGKAPTLAERFGLRSSGSAAQNLLSLTQDCVYGVVIVIPSDVVALVKVQDCVEKVLLFRSSFSQNSERIHDVVKVGDLLCMQLCFSYIFPGCRQWFAVSACKNGKETDLGISASKPVEHRPSAALACDESSLIKSENNAAALASGTKDFDYTGIIFNEKSEVLFSDPPLRGIFFATSKGTGLISFRNTFIIAYLRRIYLGLMSKEDKIQNMIPDGTVVNFEAVLKYPEGRKHKDKIVTHIATCVWIDEKPSLAQYAPASWQKRSSILLERLLERSSETFSGFVIEYYFPDIALVRIPTARSAVVFLHISSTVCGSQWALKKNLISDFVKLGDCISFNVTQDPTCHVLLRAVKVQFSTSSGEVSPSDTSVNHETSMKINDGVAESVNLSSETDEDVEASAPGNEGSSVVCSEPPLSGVLREINVDEKTLAPFDENSSVLQSEPPLSGTLQAYTKVSGMLKYKEFIIYVNVENIYLDGCLCSKGAFSLLRNKGLRVNFEAIPYSGHLEKNICTHVATCVWVGERPSLSVVALSLCKANYFCPEVISYVGQVVGFYLPEIAFLATGPPKESLVFCLHISELESSESIRVESRSNVISDFVKLLDYVQFKVKPDKKFPMGMCAYDVKKSSQNMCKSFVTTTDSKLASKSIGKYLQKLEKRGTDNVIEVSISSVAVPFQPRFPYAKRSLLLNGCGHFKFNNETGMVEVLHKLGSFDIEKTCTFESFELLNGRMMMCDIEFPLPETSNRCRLLRMWEYEKPCSESVLASMLSYAEPTEFSPTELYCGVVTAIALHDAAIAEVKGVPVVVTLDSIVTLYKVDANFYHIEGYISEGDEVIVKIKRESRPTTNEFYYKATACYKLEQRRTGRTKMEVEGVYDISWQSIWGLGEYFQTGLLQEVAGSYVVEYVSARMPDKKVILDLQSAIKSKQLFRGGKRVNVPAKSSGKNSGKEMSALLGSEISFHVGNLCLISEDFVEEVKCAWIGDYPELPLLLTDKTVAFRGLISKNWLYEGVITEFPLPTHALCKVGSVIEVYLPLQPIKTNGKMVGVVESNLKRGDVVVLKIKEQWFSNRLCLSSSLCRKKLYDKNDVMRVVRGTITKLPNPAGSIKMLSGAIVVLFDRSSVVAVNGMCTYSNVFGWAHRIDKTIEVGSIVYFSAAKDVTLNSYRAFEVWIGSLPV